MNVDVIVIGGGPSGLMAAIAAGENGANVLLIDKGNKLGRKLAISGGGRCNVTNRKPIHDIIKHIPGNGRFLYGAFSIFNNEDIIHFFNNLGIQLKEEDHGRMFPKTDKAQTVVTALLTRLKQLDVNIWTDCPVKDIIYDQNSVSSVLLEDGRKITATAIVVAVGGKTAPYTGSTGDGYPWAKKAGHTITDLFPTEVPLVSEEEFICQKELQGLSLHNVALSVLNRKGKAIVTHEMDMIFTHFGMSGPAVLRCSQFVVKEQKRSNTKEVMLRLDVFPQTNVEQLQRKIDHLVQTDAKKAIKNSLKGLLPERLLLFFLKRCQIDPAAPGTTISKKHLRQFVVLCKQFQISVVGTLPFDKAFVTGGGVSVKEIEPQTMASKLKNGLYFCGEVLDIHGYTGGYNITAALVTGRLAGLHAATYSRSIYV